MRLDEAARQLKLAVHDAQVAFDCVGLGELDRAQEHAITARAAVDAACVSLQEALRSMTPDEAARQGERAVAALEERHPA